MTIHALQKGGLKVMGRKYDTSIFFLLPVQLPYGYTY
jgi:hypothetical protein